MEHKTNLELANEFGTPIYIYRKQVIKQQVDLLQEAFIEVGINIHYACKANSNIALLTHIHSLEIGVDTVSMEEIERVLAIGFLPADILFTPSFPAVDDLNKAIKLGLKVHINSLEYIPYIEGEDVKIGVRINPEIDLELNKKTATSHKESKFGVPISLVSEIVEVATNSNVKIAGLHIHIGSGVSDWKDYRSSIDLLFDLAEQLPDIEYLDFGGGFKIKFKPSDKELDIDSLADYIVQKKKTYGRPINVLLEPGKFIVSEAGSFIAKVEMVKQGVKSQFVGLNSGFNHLFRPMYYDAYHEIINISNPHADLQDYTVVGYLCEEDTFAYNRPLPQVRRGDYLLFKNAGAYGFSMSSNYNLRKKPVEIFI